MAWQIEITRTAEKQIAKLDRPAQVAVVRFLRERLHPAKDARQWGKPLRGEYAGLWRYRIGDYRVVCEIQDRLVKILVLRVGHRKEIYR